MKLINIILRLFKLKVIKTSDCFDWCGGTYALPVKAKRLDHRYIVDRDNQIFPIMFENESERNFVIRAINKAVSNIL